MDVQDAEGKTPLMYASADGAVDLVSLLLYCKADVNIRDAEGIQKG